MKLKDMTEEQLWRRHDKLCRAAIICFALSAGFLMIATVSSAMFGFSAGLR